MIKRILRKLNLVNNLPVATHDKNEAEVDFWKKSIDDFVRWYNGEIELYETPSPKENEKINTNNIQHSAILTWMKLHQEVKYLLDLQLEKNAFRGQKLLDIGSGGIPSALVFQDCELYALDPLWGRYVSAGYPLHYYERIKFVNAASEEMPLPDHFFDAIISVNAIDHVNDFQKTALEIKRVLKEGGKLRMHIHYHLATVPEPIELNDKIVGSTFSWCKNFKKLNESNRKTGYTAPEGEFFTLWSNF
jgi:SAM-dependent methyltransferase